MRKSKQFLNLPVFSLEEGQQTGKVKGLVVDPSRKTVAALIIEEKFKEQKFIPFNRINSIGKDAVTVEHSSVIQKGSSLPEIIKLIKNKVEVTGTRIVLENGTVLGQVDEYFVDLKTGDIVGLEFSSGVLNNAVHGRAFLSSNFIRTLGKQVTVCTDESLNNITKTEGGLQETFRQVWASAINKSRSLPFKRKKINSDDPGEKPQE